MREAAFSHFLNVCMWAVMSEEQMSWDIQAAELTTVVINLTAQRKLSRGNRSKLLKLMFQTALIELWMFQEDSCFTLNS